MHNDFLATGDHDTTNNYTTASKHVHMGTQVQFNVPPNIWVIKAVPEMTYTVSGGTLNPSQLLKSRGLSQTEREAHGQTYIHRYLQADKKQPS